MACGICLAFAASCKKSNADGGYPLPVQIDSIAARYLFSDASSYGPDGLIRIHFLYQNGRIIRRQGEEVYISAYNFTNLSLQVFDTVMYAGNHILIQTISREPGYTPSANQRDFTIANGRIQQLATVSDTTTYYYSGNRLSRTERVLGYNVFRKTFSYDGNGNLTQVNSTRFNTWDSSTVALKTENFSGFDAVANPLHGFGLWDDLLYRSLSTNNFSGYEYIQGTAGGRGTMELTYTSDGKIDYGN